MPETRMFADRREAGRRLAVATKAYAGLDPIVMALPRGGVPVGFEVAMALHAPLQVLLVRKIGAPGNPEFGIGAMVGGEASQVFLNRDLVRELGVSRAYVEAEKARQMAEIARRKSIYLIDNKQLSIKDRAIILVDDGIATGGTVIVALKALRAGAAKRIVLAVPVAPKSVLDTLGDQVDDIICLASPDNFVAVGLYYADFSQTTDQEVVDLLEQAARLEHLGGRSPQ